MAQGNLHHVYDEIAEAWYGLRHWTRFGTELEEMGRRWGSGRLLNVGCGHGPDFLPFAWRFELHGVDFSRRMIDFARKYERKHGFQACLVVGDARCLPYREASFDNAVSVAAYHNIEGREKRLEAFAELRRLLKPGGEAFLTVWNRWQPRFWFSGKEAMVPWRMKRGVVQRYYYLYSRGELVADLKESGFEVLSVFAERAYRFPVAWFSRNICVLIRRRMVESK